MVISRNGQRQAQREQQKHEKEMAMEQSGHQMQQEELRDIMNKPQVLEILTQPEEHDDPTVAEISGEHMNRDQVLSIYDGDDLWRKGWKNKIWATRVSASYPFQESGSDDRLTNEILSRVHGHQKAPLSIDEERQIEALFEHKTDREKRAKGGEFVELLLSQVVESKESKSESDSGGRLSGFFGGGD